MSAPAVLTRDIAAAWRSQRGTAITLAVGALLLGALFHEEAAAAVGTWLDSTAYNHCFLVLPIAAYLVWDRRDTLRGFTAEPMPLVALAGIPIALVWLFAERLGIMEGRQLMAMSFLELLALAVLGWRLWWQLCGPLLYLYFLVPFGDFLTPKLQDITTDFVQHGLDLLNIPAYITGYTIEIPEGTFYIAEACAGLRFLIASIAFGALYALLMYRSPWRRAAFIAASLVVPVIANGFRALGIVTLGHILGSAQAAATDHVLYGWIFFSIVILLLIALGLPFREDIQPQERRPPPSHARPDVDDRWRSAALAGFLVLLCAAVSPAIAMQLDRVSLPPAGPLQALNFGAQCTDLPVAAAAGSDAPGRLIARRIACAGQIYGVQIEAFGVRSTAAPVLAEARRLTHIPNITHADEFEVETVPLPVRGVGSNPWRLVRTTEPGPMIAVAIWVDGKPASSGLRSRGHLAWESLVGAPVAPVVIAVRPERPEYWLPPSVARNLEVKLTAMLSQADLSAQVARLRGN